ncbi:hydrogenase maturation protease [bacterium]|nr:hydrogenase maturation protease [bacterium]
MSEAKSGGPRILILGLGNTILSDDGVGIYVARLIREEVPESCAAVAEASLGGLELLDLMAGYDKVILIDAMVLPDGPPGTVERVNADDLEGGSAMARHQIPFAEALELAVRLNMDVPDDIVIYGIRVTDTMTFSEECTPAVRNAIPGIAARIIRDELPCRRDGK